MAPLYYGVLWYLGLNTKMSYCHRTLYYCLLLAELENNEMCTWICLIEIGTVYQFQLNIQVLGVVIGIHKVSRCSSRFCNCNTPHHFTQQ